MAISNKKILLVEDDPTQQLLIERLINKLGHSLMGVVTTGRLAIMSVQRFNDIDLILMDVNLEGDIDGIQTMEEIRKHSNLKVIYISGYGTDEVKKRAVSTKYDAFLMKPVKMENLRAVIKEAFQD